jgi:hypothetical protein
MLLSISTVATVGSTDGNTLLNDCTDLLREKNTGTAGSSGCAGTIIGIAGTHNIFVNFKNAEEYYCMPDTIDVGQAARVIVKFLNEHPESLHNDGVSLAIMALVQAFPCDQSTQ